MKKNKIKSKGYSILELVVVIAILGTLTYFIHYNYSKVKEMIAFSQANVKIVGTLGKYRDLAYYNNKTYWVKIDTIREILTVTESGGKILEKAILPKELTYKIPNSYVSGGVLDTSVTSNGNMSNAFTIYIFGRDKLAKYRIGFYTFSQLKFLSINLYRNMTAKEATLLNINAYHKTSNAEAHIGWQKEQE